MTSSPRRTIAFEYLPEPRCLVLYQTAEPPSDAEWDAHLEKLRAVQAANADFCVFVWTDGGRPTPPQQARLAELTRRTVWKTAVVSPALAVRFVVSSLSLTKVNVRYFAPDELNEAYAHLELDEVSQRAIEQTIERFRLDLSAGDTFSAPPRSARPI